ncbi:Mur ligase family protein [Aquisalibacillus elongatus]|uniref:UDP-N-acetylmuramoylalanyl-D-glutamate--2, 6-diaminopimelate ligase n=1 Tax=Aquisalibacillus elongatus TaxID=485577 RepID=A0A3N5B6A4_9BACI|nr:UDP-N-acetylmuramyl-tripeptide synthetase [Aquisalibacillus elongatus]RPF51060.1 UDP-N-acetylmuramoylalanyl-D-glutamate--2,6-diaminopimelate ligase [Aquisalibacillus elongatus]
MQLDNLIQSIDILKSINKKSQLDITGLAYHSAKINDGNLFVCIKGFQTDGHKFLKHAVQNGAIAAVVEDVQEDVEIPQIVVQNSRIALAQLANFYYAEPSKKLNMIGITATNGKTTTTFMTNAILEQKGLNTGLIGTVAVKYGNESYPSELTTPESLDLQYYLDQMVKHEVSHVTMEVSSKALESYRVEKVDYDIVTLNNISREHIDDHGSFQQYFDSKASLIRNASENSFAVLNLDNDYSASLINETNASVVTFGVESNNGHLTCKSLDLSTGRAKFTVEVLKPFGKEPNVMQPQTFDIELSVPGLHSVYNSMVAITCGLLNGISISNIQNALKHFVGVERRFEYIYEGDFKVIDDHFANAGNIEVTLKTVQHMDYNQFHLVYSIRGGRGPTVNRENAEAIAYWAPKLGLKDVYATKSESHVASKDQVSQEEEEAFLNVLEEAGINVNLYNELNDAIDDALNKTQSNDLVILGGAQGMDYGAGLALESLHKLKPHLSDEELFLPLKNRVAGVTKKQRELLLKLAPHQ